MPSSPAETRRSSRPKRRVRRSALQYVGPGLRRRRGRAATPAIQGRKRETTSGRTAIGESLEHPPVSLQAFHVPTEEVRQRGTAVEGMGVFGSTGPAHQEHRPARGPKDSDRFVISNIQPRFAVRSLHADEVSVRYRQMSSVPAITPSQASSRSATRRRAPPPARTAGGAAGDPVLSQNSIDLL